jgi:hypothetical protein
MGALMTKTNRKPVPSYVPNDFGAAGELDREPEQTASDTKKAEQAPRLCLTKTILPMVAGEAPGFQTKHIELQLSTEEAAIVARLRVGLSEEHRQLAKGKHVESANDAVRWLIQQIVGAVVGKMPA